MRKNYKSSGFLFFPFLVCKTEFRFKVWAEVVANYGHSLKMITKLVIHLLKPSFLSSLLQQLFDVYYRLLNDFLRYYKSLHIPLHIRKL